MRLSRFAIILSATTLALWFCACSPDDELDPMEGSPVGPSDGGALQGPSHEACANYCEAITTQADGCEHYNDHGRCEDICGYYAKSACAAEWKAYTECMTADVKAACITPSDGGKIALDVQGCESTFTTWHDCRDAKHATPCPY